LDGRTFSVNMSPQQMFPIGCFVSLTDDHGDIRLAQVESHRLVPGGPMQATGRMLGVLDADGLDSNATPVLGSATVTDSKPEMITRLNTGAGATLDIGSMSARSDLPARLLPRRLKRHTPLVRPERIGQDVRARRQGEALFAGGFASVAMTVQVRNRLTQEGGRDVAVPLRQ